MKVKHAYQFPDGDIALSGGDWNPAHYPLGTLIKAGPLLAIVIENSDGILVVDPVAEEDDAVSE